MSGPPYPHPNPAPGSNAIGSFAIGVSQMGDIRPFDVWSTIISQYANSEALTALLVDFSDYVDQTINLNDFFDLIWSIDSAQGYGLDVWGRILGIGRTVQIPNNDAFWGFQEAGDPNFVGFNQAPYYSGQRTNTNFSLSDTAYRRLLLAKAMTNVSDGSSKAVNLILLSLFPGRGNCYVRDNLDMTITYVFFFPLTPVELTIVQLSGALPKPAGVSATVSQELP